MNRPTLFLIAMIVEASVVSIAATGQSYNRPRFTMPKDGHRGWIDFDQYVAMEDPVAAGAGDELTRGDRAGHDAHHQREHQQAGLSG